MILYVTSVTFTEVTYIFQLEECVFSVYLLKKAFYHLVVCLFLSQPGNYLSNKVSRRREIKMTNERNCDGT